MQLYVVVPDLLVAWIYLMGFIALAVLSKSFETLALCQQCVEQNTTIGTKGGGTYYKQHNAHA